MDELLYKCALKVAYSLFKSRNTAYLVRELYGSAEDAARVACFLRSDLPLKFKRLEKGYACGENAARASFYCTILRRFFAADIAKYNNHDLRTAAHKGEGYLVPRAGKLVTQAEDEKGRSIITSLQAKVEKPEEVSDRNAFIAKVRALDLNEQQRETLELLLEGYDIASIEKKLKLGRSAAYQRAKSLVKRVRLYLAPEVPEDAPFNAIGSRKHKKT